MTYFSSIYTRLRHSIPEVNRLILVALRTWYLTWLDLSLYPGFCDPLSYFTWFFSLLPAKYWDETLNTLHFFPIYKSKNKSIRCYRPLTLIVEWVINHYPLHLVQRRKITRCCSLMLLITRYILMNLLNCWCFYSAWILLVWMVTRLRIFVCRCLKPTFQ